MLKKLLYLWFALSLLFGSVGCAAVTKRSSLGDKTVEVGFFVRSKGNGDNVEKPATSETSLEVTRN